MASTAISKRFADRLSTLLAEAKSNGKDYKLLSKDLGISTGALSNYANDVQQANITAAGTIADYFGVSIDWLLGLTDVRPQDATLQEVCRYTGLSENLVSWLHDSNNQQYCDSLFSRIISLNDWGDSAYAFNRPLSDSLLDLLSYSPSVDDSMLGVLLDVQKAQRAYEKAQAWNNADRRNSGEVQDIKAAEESGFIVLFPEDAYRHSIELAVAAFRRIITAMIEAK